MLTLIESISALMEINVFFIRINKAFHLKRTRQEFFRLQDLERRGSKSSILGTLGLGDGVSTGLQQRRPSFQALGESVVSVALPENWCSLSRRNHIK